MIFKGLRGIFVYSVKKRSKRIELTLPSFYMIFDSPPQIRALKGLIQIEMVNRFIFFYRNAVMVDTRRKKELQRMRVN